MGRFKRYKNHYGCFLSTYGTLRMASRYLFSFPSMAAKMLNITDCRALQGLSSCGIEKNIFLDPFPLNICSHETMKMVRPTQVRVFLILLRIVLLFGTVHLTKITKIISFIFRFETQVISGICICGQAQYSTRNYSMRFQKSGNSPQQLKKL